MNTAAPTAYFAFCRIIIDISGFTVSAGKIPHPDRSREDTCQVCGHVIGG
jgi:hypothetical protein